MTADLARRLRYSTGPRFIALYLVLTLLSAIPLFVFIYHQTDRLLVAEAREVVAEHFNLLEAEHREGGIPQVAEFIVETVTSGAAAHEAYLLVDARGTPIAGNLSAWPPISPAEERWKELLLYRRGQDRPETIGFSIVHLPEGHRLLMGRVMDDRGRLREALIATLASALLLAIPIAFIGSMILLKFMNSRVEAMADAAARVTSGELQTRIGSHGTDDPFDRLAAALNAMLERLERLVDELRFVTDTLAHDLRSPLTRMRATLERAAASRDPGELHSAATAIAGEIDAMLRMTGATIEVSRAEAGLGREEFVTLDAAALARDLCELYEPLAAERGVRLLVDAPVSAELRGHDQMLGQALSNLIDNALKYAGSGGEIRLELKQNDDELFVSVADRGPGIPPERRAEALRRHGRLDCARGGDGGGLGLSLVAAVARLHGGALRLEDNAPGLRAVLALPRNTILKD